MRQDLRMGAAWWSARDYGIDVTVRVMPGARRSELVDVSNEMLRIRVGAPARDGKANAAVQRFVADLFGVRPGAVEIVHGEHLRDKVVAIRGITEPPPDLRDRP
jgi:uncharacterized protein (TIGR00251 family)